MTDEAPDAVGTVAAWRFWRNCDDAGLRSIAQEAVWVPGKAQHATCLRHNPFVAIRDDVHAAPAEQCVCGIYALSRLADVLAEYDVDDGAFASAVLGEVRLWGVTYEGPRGIRAEYAYPARLWVVEPAAPTDPIPSVRLARVGRVALARELERRWRVPCRLASLASACAEVGEPSVSRDRPSAEQWAVMDFETRAKVRTGLGEHRAAAAGFKYAAGGVASPRSSAVSLTQVTTSPLSAAFVTATRTPPAKKLWVPASSEAPPPLRQSTRYLAIGMLTLAAASLAGSQLPWYALLGLGPFMLFAFIMTVDALGLVLRGLRWAGWFVALREGDRMGFAAGRDGWPPRWFVRVGFGEGLRFKVWRWQR
jgi:hypothetical protein